ncbi:MAG: hypothetical protein ACOYXU_14970 [Nitrospirota bacterium]
MSGKKPLAALVRKKGTDRWKVELRDLKSFRDTLGPDVVNAFCRCFVHADRLMSLISFGRLSLKHYGSSSRGFTRNLQTMVWFTVGTLRELALALRDLRSALAKRNMLDLASKPWQTLREVEDRWERAPFFREMRNVAAFHVDSEVIDRGLDAMEADGNAILCDGEGKNRDRSSMRLGLEALLNGSGKSLADLDQFMKTVSEDHGIYSTIEEAFFLVLQAKAVLVQEVEGDA